MQGASASSRNKKGQERIRCIACTCHCLAEVPYCPAGFATKESRNVFQNGDPGTDFVQCSNTYCEHVSIVASGETLTHCAVPLARGRHGEHVDGVAVVPPVGGGGIGVDVVSESKLEELLCIAVDFT